VSKNAQAVKDMAKVLAYFYGENFFEEGSAHDAQLIIDRLRELGWKLEKEA
jgi:hypothetical protein